MSAAATAYATRPADSAAPAADPLAGLDLPPLRTIGFPGRDAIVGALGAFPAPQATANPYGAPGGGLGEGRAFTLTVGPGLVRFAATDPNRLEHRPSANAYLEHGSFQRGVQWKPYAKLVAAAQAEAQASAGAVDGAIADLSSLLGAEVLSDTRRGPEPKASAPVPWRFVMNWSRRSRGRFHQRIVSVDWTPFFDQPGLPVMVTLTYPAEWRSVADNGRVVKGHLQAFKKRWERHWGRKCLGMWKLEFQDRWAPDMPAEYRGRAPHFHLFVVQPGFRNGKPVSAGAFKAWVSTVWAEIVGHADPVEYAKHLRAGTGVDTQKGGDCRDPRRLAVYFAKHSAKTGDGKNYQHNVPREWLCDENGVIDPTRGPGRFWGFWHLDDATETVVVPMQDYFAARRIARRWAKARASYLGRRAPRSLGVGGGIHGGWLMVNDGPAFAGRLAYALDVMRGPDRR